MWFFTRRYGSQRKSATRKINFHATGEFRQLTLKDDRDVYYVFEFESMAEVKQLLSSAHIIHGAWTAREPR